MTETHAGTSRTADLDGPTHYLDFGGPVDAPLIVAVHGLGGGAWNWLAIAPLLAPRYRVIAIDLAGHGLTPSAGRSTAVKANRRLLDRFLREIITEPVILMGNSMGGLISLLETAAAPELVLGGVLIDPALPRPRFSRIDPRVFLQFAVMAVPRLGEAALTRSQSKQTVAQQVRRSLTLCTVDLDRVPDAVVAEGIRTISSRRPGDFSASDTLVAARSLLRMLARPAVLHGEIRTINAPVLLLHGHRDRLIPLAAAEEAARAYPAWRFEIATDIGHVPMLEAAEWTAALVLDWIESTITSRRDAQ